MMVNRVVWGLFRVCPLQEVGKKKEGGEGNDGGL
jgi:hypothetical protein